MPVDLGMMHFFARFARVRSARCEVRGALVHHVRSARCEVRGAVAQTVTETEPYLLEQGARFRTAIVGGSALRTSHLALRTRAQQAASTHSAPSVCRCQRHALSLSARTAAPMRLVVVRLVALTLACATASRTPMRARHTTTLEPP